MSRKPRRSSKLKSINITERPYPDIPKENLNDDTWSCTVAVIVEKTADYKKYVKSFEEAAKFGRRPVIKNITMKDLEGDAVKNRPDGSKRVKGTAKKSEVPLQPAASENMSIVENILKIIYRLKEEDVKLMNSRNKDRETCKAAERDESRLDIEQGIIHDEPLCGPSLYVVLTGFYSLEILVRLLQLRVPVESIVSFSDSEKTDRERDSAEVRFKTTDTDPSRSFWADYADLVQTDTGQKLVCDTMELDCNPEEILTGKDGLKQNRINDLIYDFTCEKLFQVQTAKREYIHFIRNTKKIELDLVERTCTDEMASYRRSIRSVPLQIVTVDHILNCIIDQVEYDQLTVAQHETSDKAHGREAIDAEVNSDENTELSNDYSDEKPGAKNIGLNLSPVVIEMKNERAIEMNYCHDYYRLFQDYYVKILERSVCPLVWRFYPLADTKDRLSAVSHFQKLNGFIKTGHSGIVESVIHKKLFNRMLLSCIDSRNVDLLPKEVFDAFLAADSSEETFTWEEEQETVSDAFGTDDRVTPDNVLTATINGWNATGDTSAPDLKSTINQPINNLNKFVFRCNERLKELKSFLKFPELDNLLGDGSDALSAYNLVESYGKETALHVLDTYGRTYSLIQFSYFTATDCLLFLFHNGLNEANVIATSDRVHILTPVGFRDYCNHLTKIYRYSSWVRRRVTRIEEENAESLRRLGVVPDGYDAQRCCFEKIKNYGFFPTVGTPAGYRSHAPHPPARFAGTDEKDTPFVAYGLKRSRFANCSEKSTEFVSKSGARISVKSKIVFNSETYVLSFRHPLCSIYYEFAGAGVDSGNTRNKVNCETDNGIRLLFVGKRTDRSDVSGSKPERNRSGSRGKERFQGTRSGFLEYLEEEGGSDASVMLPNGLQISKLIVDGEVYGIKQKRLDDPATESCRIYLKDGTVLVVTLTGSIIVYYSNTTVTTIKTVCSEKDFQTVCADSLSSEQNKNERRDHSYHVIGEHRVLTWSGLEKTFKFNRCCDSTNKYLLRTAYDPGKALFTLRSDGTESLLDRDGVLVTQFPDGTRITCTPEERITALSELDSASSDGSNKEWVLIDQRRLMERPENYAPVEMSRGECIVHLPGDKKLSFTDLEWTSLKTNETELCFDGTNRVVYYNTYDRNTRSFGNFLISLDPRKENIIGKFKDEDFCFTIDSNCNADVTENRFEDVGSSFVYQTHWERLRNFSAYVTENPLSDQSRSEPSLSDSEGRPYIFKPTAQQKNIKMFVLRRDLSGYELTDGSNNYPLDQISLKKTYDSANIKEYKNGNYTISLTDIPPLTSNQVTSYLNPCCFSSSDLRRNDLSPPLPATKAWLVSAAESDRANSRPDKPQVIGNSFPLTRHVNRTKQTQKPPLILLKKYIDLTNFKDIENSMNQALESYLDYKKTIYSAILKNTLDDIASKQRKVENC